MEPAIVMLALLAALAIWQIARRRTRPPERPPLAPERVEVLCARLGGEPARDRAAMNRILALGPEVVPLLLDQLAEDVRVAESPPTRLVSLEGLIAEFGLAAVGPVTAVLGRLRPTTPLAASLLRVLDHLGQPGVVALVSRAMSQPELTPFLPRLRQPRPAAATPAVAIGLALATRPPSTHRADLRRATALLAAWPEVIDDLWAAWGSEGRVAILGWLADWLPLARIEHLLAGLADPADPVRRAAAHLASMMVEPALVPVLAELAEAEDPGCRLAAVEALAAWQHPEAIAALVHAAGDRDPTIAAAALFGLTGAPGMALSAGVAAAQALAGRAVGALLAAEAPFSPGAGDPEALIRAASRAEGPDRALLFALLGRHANRHPRAREALIRLADADVAADRALAVWVLSRQGDPTAADLLGRALRGPLAEHDRRLLGEAAQHLGAAAIAPIAHRLAADQLTRLSDQLAILRVQDYAAAVPALLQALEEVRGGEAEALIGATIAVGGPGVAEALDESLRLPSLGMLTPALRHLGAYGTASDVPRLLGLFDRHPPLRGIILNLVELQGIDAVGPLAQRIARGGDDAIIDALEQRHALLAATTAAPGRISSDRSRG